MPDVSFGVSFDQCIFTLINSRLRNRRRRKVPNCGICGRFMHREGIQVFHKGEVVYRSESCNIYKCDSNRDGHVSTTYFSPESQDNDEESIVSHSFQSGIDEKCSLCGFSREWSFHV